jgi:O-antigen/teichoic acid export membrane protein
LSRKKYFFTGLGSSYLVTAVNFAYTALSVPLALHFCSQAEFGVWALVIQFSAYLLLVDMGVSAAVSRLLADYKDDQAGAAYGRIFYSSILLSIGQGLALFAIGALIAWQSASWVNLPPDLHPVFRHLMFVQSAVVAGSFLFRPLSSPLWSHQRLDIGNLGNGLGMALSLLGLVWGFHHGWGLYSMVLGSALGAVPGLLIPCLACRHFGYYPRWIGWEQLRKADWPALFVFSRDIFTIQLGAQLASATQLFLVSRWMSVESAATWAIATKAFILGQQLCQRVMDASAAALAEMYVRQERARFALRFGQVVETTAWLSGTAGLVILFLNTPGVALWTGGRILWPANENIWLAFLLVSTCTARCHLSLAGITKKTAGLRWIQLAEGGLMVGISLLLIKALGFSAILIASLVANFGITLATSQWLTSKQVGLSLAQIFRWILPAFCVLAVGACVRVAIYPLSSNSTTDIHQMLPGAILVVILAGVALRFCLRSETRRELFSHFRRP